MYRSVERFKQDERVWQTTDDRPRYGEMRRNKRNCLFCKKRFCLKIKKKTTVNCCSSESQKWQLILSGIGKIGEKKLRAIIWQALISKLMEIWWSSDKKKQFWTFFETRCNCSNPWMQSGGYGRSLWIWWEGLLSVKSFCVVLSFPHNYRSLSAYHLPRL